MSGEATVYSHEHHWMVLDLEPKNKKAENKFNEALQKLRGDAPGAEKLVKEIDDIKPEPSPLTTIEEDEENEIVSNKKLIENADTTLPHLDVF